MLDLFTIFTKGGIVLWYIQGTALSLTPAVNALIKSVILQERGGASAEFAHENLMLKFKMDNEFELVYVAVYQKIVQLSYIDKLLDQVSLAFRDRYKNELVTGPFRMVNFTSEFNAMLRALEEDSRLAAQKPRVMKKFHETRKAEKFQANTKSDKKLTPPTVEVEPEEEEDDEEGREGLCVVEEAENGGSGVGASPRNKTLNKLGTRGRGGAKPKKTSTTSTKKPKEPAKRVKEARTWSDGKVSKAEAECLNRSEQVDENSLTNGSSQVYLPSAGEGKILSPLEVSSSESPDEPTATKSSSGGGMFSFFKNLTGGKVITEEMLEPALEKMKEHLITKNVAAEISEKLCSSVMSKLEGKVIGTFSGIQSTVRKSMEESLVQILSPKRRIDVLRDVLQAGKASRPYVITFCGVNGVGKSTNLAKIAFWLLENNHRVLIAACDTFRSGAVEQLRTHARHLGSLHPPAREGAPTNILLYDRGYGKDAAGVAMEAIHFAGQQGYDVVLVDTAGRMQDNEPLMRSLAKLIRVNTPDLVLFVGEALVGNEAVDQLVKFNRALVDHSEEGCTRTIDGILLTKFDTIDDKVGAAISMTYTTGQPIVFVGTGQRYTDLRSLNVQAVVSALLQ